MAAWGARIWPAMKARGAFYWARAAVVLAVAFAIEHYTADSPLLRPARYAMFQTFSDFSPRKAEPKNLKILLVNDDEYWRGKQLAHRSPTNRDYLAALVDKLTQDNASLIALDFDLPLDPQAKAIPGDFSELPDYKPETDHLIRSILAAAQDRNVILSKNIFKVDNGYTLAPDVFQLYGLCLGFDAAGNWRNPGIDGFRPQGRAAQNIQCGYIALPPDMRLIPPPLYVQSKYLLDSFSMAISRVINPVAAAEASGSLLYGNYIREAVLRADGAILSAGDLMQGKDLWNQIHGNRVIVGAHWQLAGPGEGAFVDAHDTPADSMNGAMIQADFAEAILDSRAFGYAPAWLLTVTELVFSIGAAIVFSVMKRPWKKFAAFVGITVFLLFVQWQMLIAVGTYFEAFIPIAGLWLHSLLERLAGSEHEPG